MPLPQVLIAELNAQMETVMRVHQEDLAAGITGTLPGALGGKCNRAEKELVWQWLFPARKLTQIPATREYRQYHLHRLTYKQRSRDGQRSQIPKWTLARTFRHSFAVTYCSHSVTLKEANVGFLVEANGCSWPLATISTRSSALGPTRPRS